MTMKKKILTTLSVVLILGLAALGILAYLQDEDSDVNVMTLGNVQIDQIEQEWNADKTELVDFTQAKPLYPYVGEMGWKDRVDKNSDPAKQAYRQFAMNNVVDKYVSVKNTGKSDAYVRTFIALEMGDYSYKEFNMVGISNNSASGFEFPNMHWKWTDDFVAEIDGHNYNVMVAVHDEAVEPNETTIPSLLQVYLSKDATNETVEKLDGNGNGTYDILVFSQAVQTEGFADAKTALNTAFGDTSDPTRYHPWGDNAPGTIVSNGEELEEALSVGGKITLGANITVEELAINKSTILDLNNCTLTVTALDVSADAELYDGTIEHGQIAYENKYGFIYEGNSAIHVSGGDVAFNNIVVDCMIPCTLKIMNNSTIELVGIHVAGGNVTLNDVKLNIKNDSIYGNLIQYETLLGACIDSGTLTMNNSKISFKGLGGRDSTDYLGIVARTDATKIVNMNNSVISEAMMYVVSTGKNATINTTDSEVAWTGKYAGNVTVNFNK